MTHEPQLSPLKRAYLEIERLRAQVRGMEQKAAEPIAIIGLGCRIPGAPDPSAYWRLLRDGVDAIREVPGDRWDINELYDPDPEVAGKLASRWGGFLEHIDRFDPRLFGIAPREAARMDPQQRLLLEVAWEALESACIAPDRLEGTAAGVFVGVATNDYALLLAHCNDYTVVDSHNASGIAESAVSGRLSYLLGLTGPAVSVDTACSSSLVAVHLACQSLRTGECRMAIAGGVNTIALPDNGIMFSRSALMARDGRCKTFDAAADGFARAEGCGVVVLKRLADAVADGDRVLAVVRGTAANQDGASSALTVPNGPSQAAVVRQALANAGVAPHEISFVETHGTGTSLGDPIEVQALGEALGEGRGADAPVWLGAVKTNVGHLEAAAGITGLIKTVLALHHETIPANLHFRVPNPHVDWSRYPCLQVPVAAMPWPRGAQRRCAGVSSFGFSGTNVHVVLEEAPRVVREEAEVERPAHVVTLSARSQPALQQLAGAWATHLRAHPEHRLADIAFSANTGRARFEERLAVIAASADEVVAPLTAFGEGDARAVIAGRVRPAHRPRPVFLFTGQGSQWAKMGQELYATQPTFRRVLEECDAILAAHLERPLLSVLYGEDRVLLDQTSYTQPALFALEYALAVLWRSWGVEPAVVMGHGVGEYVAACVAGVFTLQDGLTLIAERGRLMHGLPVGGGMAAVRADGERVAAALAGTPDVVIAAVNGPADTVISGPGGAVDAVLARLGREGIGVSRLQSSHAFHSPLMEPMLEEFRAAAAAVTYAAPQMPLFSNVSGAPATAAQVSRADYWVEHVRRPVQFCRSVRRLVAEGHTTFVEIGPHPVLVAMARACLEDDGGTWLPSLHRGQDGWQPLLTSLATLWVSGVEVDWASFDRDYSRQRLDLPTYPFQRQRYWIEQGTPGVGRSVAGTFSPSTRPATTDAHPLLGSAFRSPRIAETVFQSELGADHPAFLRDHRVLGGVVLPAAAYLEMVLSSVTSAKAGDLVVEDVVFGSVLRLPDQGTVPVQVVLTPDTPGVFSFAVISGGGGRAGRGTGGSDDADGPAWVEHATGTLRSSGATTRGSREVREPLGAEGPTGTLTLDQAKARCTRDVDVDEFYQGISARGVELGETFRVVRRVLAGDGDALVGLAMPNDPDAPRYTAHPVLIDGFLQAVAAAVGSLPEDAAGEVLIPFAVERIELFKRPDAEACDEDGCVAWSYARLRHAGATGDGTRTADIHAFDSAGRPLAALVGLRLRRLATAHPESVTRGMADWLYEVQWEGRPLADDDGSEIAVASRAIPEAAETARRAASDLARQHGMPEYNALAARLETVCAAYIVAALEELGLQLRAGARIKAQAVLDALGVESRYHRLLARWLRILESQGILASDGDSLLVVSTPDRDAVAAARLLDATRGGSKAVRAELGLVERVGARLADCLRGNADALALLFPGGSFDAADLLYRASPPALVINGLAREALRTLLGGHPRNRPFRVLEIGAGTGGTTSFLLDRFDPASTEYVFTDISPLFLSRGRERFGASGFMRFELLDIEQEPEQQGFIRHQYDLVIAANCLHATADLSVTLEHVSRLLRPGGVLMLLEGTKPSAWYDVTFGLTDGWWRFRDEHRRDYPLLPTDSWARLLSEGGFADIVAVPGEEAVSVAAGNALILASIPEPNAAADRGRRTGERWIVMMDQRGVGDRLCGLLMESGAEVVCVPARGVQSRSHGGSIHVDTSTPGDLRRVIGEAIGAGCTGVIDLWALHEIDPCTARAEDVRVAQETGCLAALELVQACLGSVQPPPVWLVTSGAQKVGDRAPTAPWHATQWGFGKVVNLEHPDLRCVTIDIDPEDGPEVAARLLHRELDAADGESEIGYRRGVRYVARLRRYVAEGPEEPRGVDDGRVQLVCESPGVLDELVWRRTPRPTPGPDEVAIRVQASGLNFRDVLMALGMYPGNDVVLGGECAGIIEAVGRNVAGLRVGDEVMALVPGAFASHVVAASRFVLTKPGGLSMDEAATIPAAFMTAQYTLRHLAKLAAGERVLIHAAAGGVGQAAVQIAQTIGAEIFATAGSPRKREFLAAQGIAHVMDSRSLEFRDRIREVTQGSGVDVVLNCLTGDFIPASLEALGDRGRFVEIGKRGIWTCAEIAARRPDVDYHVVDLAGTAVTDSELVGTLLAEVDREIAAGRVGPLRHEVFRSDQVGEAFRHMAQARHIGKVVVTAPDAEAWCRSRPGGRLRADGTYLITGGLGGLGLAVAGRMVREGARHVVLLGRTAPTADASAVISEMTKRGAQVRVLSCDVSREADLAKAMSAVSASMPPVRGIVHAAGVLADGVVTEQRRERFQAVFAPKLVGTWNLHRLTQDMTLDFFILFSSVSAIFGSPGQCNHAAANAFLGQMAHFRRGAGRAGQSIDWGAWAEIGAAAAHNVGERIATQGVGTIDPTTGLDLCEALMAAGVERVAVAPIDWGTFLREFPRASETAFFEHLMPVGGVSTVPEAAETRDLPQGLEHQAPSSRMVVLVDHVRNDARRVLGLLPSDLIDDDTPLQELGLDSLLAVELRNRLKVSLRLERPLPATLVFDYPTVEQMARYLAEQHLGWDSDGADGEAPDRLQSTEAVVDTVGKLSDEEVERSLAERLSRASTRLHGGKG